MQGGPEPLMVTTRSGLDTTPMDAIEFANRASRIVDRLDNIRNNMFGNRTISYTPRAQQQPHSQQRAVLTNRSRSVVRTSTRGQSNSNAGYGGKWYKKRKSRTSKLKGKFLRRKARRRAKILKPTMTKCVKYGVTAVDEINGSRTNSQMLLFGHQVYSLYRAYRMLAMCLVKELWRRDGFQVTNWDDFIPTYTGAVNDVVVIISDVDGVNMYNQSFTGGVSKFTDVYVSLANYLKNLSAGNTAVNPINIRVPGVLQLYVANTASIPNNLRVNIPIQGIIINIVGQSTIKIQNRTKAVGSGTNADDVSNNPLEGKIYPFKNNPKPLVKYLKPIENGFTEQGVLVKTPAEFDNKAEMFEPPYGRIFANCGKTTRVILQPGQIKTSNLYGTKRINMISFLNESQYHVDEGVEGFRTYAKCNWPCEIIALEDVINVNVLENIDCAYAVDRKMGMYLKFPKAKPTQSSYLQRHLPASYLSVSYPTSASQADEHSPP